MRGYRAHLQGTEADPSARPTIYRVATWTIDCGRAMELGRTLNERHHEGAFRIRIEEADVVSYPIRFRNGSGAIREAQIYVPQGQDPDMEASHHAHMEGLEKAP
jgi:hypothetical protein